MALREKVIEFDHHGTATRLTLGALSALGGAKVQKYSRERERYFLDELGIDLDVTGFDELQKDRLLGPWISLQESIAVLSSLRKWEQKQGKEWKPVEYPDSVIAFADMVDDEFLAACQDAYHELSPDYFIDFRPKSDEEESAEKNDETTTDDD